MNSLNLPLELIQIIIDNLTDDPQTLRNCSLVSRSWLHPSHRRLFCRIVLFPARHLPPGNVLQSVRLYNILLVAPYIADCIQELKVYEGKRYKDEDWIKTDQTLPLLLLKLTNLKRIELMRLYWSELSLDLRQSIRSVLNLRSLTFVEIADSQFASVDDFTGLLSYGENITVLSLRNIETSFNVSERLTQEETGVKKRPFDSYKQKHLLELNYALGGVPKFNDWILGPQSPWDVSHVHTLKILHVHQSDINTINRLLHAIGSELRRFEFNIDIRCLMVTDINLEYNLNLQNFKLDLTLAVLKIRDSLLQLIRLFSSFAESNRLEEIELVVEDHPGHRLVDWSSWEGVDRLLAGPKFKCLQKVDIDTWSVQRAESRKIMRDLLRWSPLLEERGILVIQ